MTVGIDYEGTWTLDPVCFEALSTLLKSHGHTVILVTNVMGSRRKNEVREAIGTLMPIVFSAGEWKHIAAMKAGYEVDVWVDDLPELIRPSINIDEG